MISIGRSRPSPPPAKNGRVRLEQRGSLLRSLPPRIPLWGGFTPSVKGAQGAAPSLTSRPATHKDKILHAQKSPGAFCTGAWLRGLATRVVVSRRSARFRARGSLSTSVLKTDQERSV